MVTGIEIRQEIREFESLAELCSAIGAPELMDWELLFTSFYCAIWCHHRSRSQLFISSFSNLAAHLEVTEWEQ